jgi:3-phenylpropionate/trans-cinnamate dioxygenase ferredoxin subunit
VTDREDPSLATESQPRGDVLADVQQLISELEAHSDPDVGEKVRELLAGIDAVHRTALTHLMAAIQGLAGEAFVNRITADPAVRLLLMSYDLLAVDRRLLAEEALDLVRGHLHAHGIDVELLDVVGGVVYVRLHGAGRDTVPREAIQRDLEEALREGLLGFQELEFRETDRASEASSFVPLGIRRANRPVYHEVFATSELGAGELSAVVIGTESVLIANIGGEFVAVRNRCGVSPLPLQFSTLNGTELTCSWHGCRYDLRSGHRLDLASPAPDERLSVLPVAVQDGMVRVAVSVEPAGAS